MSKRVDAGAIDAASVISHAKPGNRAGELKPYDPSASAPSAPPPSAEPEPEREKKTPSEEPRRHKNKIQEYENLFFKAVPIKTRSGKVVYIRKEHHDRLLKIVRVIGDNEFTLFNYLDNILEEHFSTYQDEITELYDKKNTGVF